MENYLIAKYGELTLKGKNRPDFVDTLEMNIKRLLGKAKISDYELQSRHSLLFIKTDEKVDEICRRVSKVCGLSYVAAAIRVESSLEAINKAAVKLMRNKIGKAKNFRVETKRSDKDFPLNSMQINEQVGGKIEQSFSLNVDLDNPDITLYIELYADHCFLYTQKYSAPGGLPVGSSGRGLVLLSGGIDSAVAAWMMQRRGLACDYVHFHALPGSDDPEEILPVEIAKRLAVAQGVEAKLYLLPYHPFQLALLETESRYELVVFRRFMLAVAEKIARKENLPVLITGDNLGQVASQTLENLVTTNSVVTKPVFRPLIGENKQDIIDMAKTIGTYKLSIRDYKDCCSIIDRHPATKSSIKKVVRIERELDLDGILEQTMSKMVVVEIQ